MVDVLAIVSKAVFEDQALVYGDLVGVGDVWAIDRYVSTHKALEKLREGGRIFLVTVRPTERLWLVGVLEAPVFDGTEWVARSPNHRPVADITALRDTIRFARGTGIAPGWGAMAMSLQTPRALAPDSAEEILAVTSGAKPPPVPAPRIVADGPAQEEPATPPPPIAILAPQRAAALHVDIERFVVLADKMQETYGLRLSEELAYVAGFLAGLAPSEREEIEHVVGRLAGIGRWFSDEPPQRPPGGDERLRDRAVDDPPEFVPVFTCPDGERWGYWYDDPEELPRGIARRLAVSDTSAPQTQFHARSLLLALRDRIDTSELPHRAELLEVLDEVRRREAADVKERTALPRPERQVILGSSIAVHQPDGVPFDLVGQRALRHREEAYLSGASEVDDWIEQARSELREGVTALALILGHELHYLQLPKWRSETTELLIRAYSVLGRRALADIVRATYLHHAPSVSVYELPLRHSVRSAAVAGDVEAIISALDEASPTVHDLEDALASAPTTDAIDAIAGHSIFTGFVGERSPVDVALRRRLRAMDKAHGSAQRAQHRALAVHLLERAGVSARGFAHVLQYASYDDGDLVVRAAAHADVASTYDGATALHIAARAARSESVKVLLDRGADVNARNRDGKTAYDLLRDALAENPSAFGVSEALVHLQRAGAGPQKPPPLKDLATEYAEGDAVHHKKLGDGIVEAVTGEGEEAKLLIRFATETRTFLAKFVTPKA